MFFCQNTREICGNIQFRRFAYVHKKNDQLFGLLEATGKQNAKEHLGQDFIIKETWLSLSEEKMTLENRELERSIVASLFPGMVGISKERIDDDEPSIDFHVDKLIEENKELKRKLEDMFLFNHVEIVETKRKVTNREKKPEKKCSTDQIEIEKLKAHASSYSNCLWSHCQDASNSKDVNVLFNHAKYVTRNAEECWRFLKVRGVLSVDSKHCQYFFSICWPVYKPWQELNRHVLDKLLEDGTLKKSDIPDNPWGNTRPFFNAVKEQKP